MSVSRWVLVCVVLATFSSTRAHAHPVTVDGTFGDWLDRAPMGANLGIVARNSSGSGELVWVDATGDVRTDLASSSIGDLTRFALTADATNLYVRLEYAGPPDGVASPVGRQIQIAVDLDRVSGSGALALVGAADTSVSENARWEYLIQTQRFPASPSVRVLDPALTMTGSGAGSFAVRSAEISVPWSAMGLTGPPAAARFTVAIFRESSGDTYPIGDATVSNAVDALSDGGDPGVAPYPNSFVNELNDADVDYSMEVFFEPDGDVYAPLLLNRFLPAGVGPVGTTWFAVRNQTNETLAIAEYSVGDAEVPDAPEAMLRFPLGTTLAAGATFFVAAAASFQSTYGRSPDAAYFEMRSRPTWSNGTLDLPMDGDALVVLGPSHTLLDVVPYGTGSYDGLNSVLAPGAGYLLVRRYDDTDADHPTVDFTRYSDCASIADCASCHLCDRLACTPSSTLSCDDGVLCDGPERCTNSGACVSASMPHCDDENPCTEDACEESNGSCTHTFLGVGASCNDGDDCDGSADMCDEAMNCVAVGPPADCSDGDPCTMDLCYPGDGCYWRPVAEGGECANGDACTLGTCDAAGACVGAAPRVCDDANACTVDACDPSSGCTFVPNVGAACSDADACNGTETCDASGACVSSGALGCDDGNACTIDACDATSSCTHSIDANAACEDGDPCTIGDSCSAAGACTSGAREPGCVATPDAGTTPDAGLDSMDGGCGCAAPGASRGHAGWLALVLFVLGMRRRARRARELRT